MKSNTSRRWMGALALAFVIATVALQFQSAQAQYGYDPSLSDYKDVSSTMIERGGFLYIVQGGTVYKVRAKDMVVVGRTVLKSPFTVYPTTTPNWGMGTPTLTPGEGTPTSTAFPTPTAILSNG